MLTSESSQAQGNFGASPVVYSFGRPASLRGHDITSIAAVLAILGYSLTIWSVSWLGTLAVSKIRIELLQAGGADSVREIRVGVVRGEHGMPRPSAVSLLEPRAGATQYEEIE